MPPSQSRHEFLAKCFPGNSAAAANLAGSTYSQISGWMEADMVEISDTELLAVWGSSIAEGAGTGNQPGLMARALASIQTLVETKPGTANPNDAYYARLYAKSPHLLNDIGVRILPGGGFERINQNTRKIN
jgi:hypothetical protein